MKKESTEAGQSPSHDLEENRKNLKHLIERIKVAMMVTVNEEGGLNSRPMMVQEIDEEGSLWFFTGQNSGKVDAILEDCDVNLSFSQPDDSRYVSVGGRARLVDDSKKIHELWKTPMLAWFPDGPDDPNILLVKVEPQQAEYWDSASGKLVQLFGFVKAVATGKPYRGEGTDHQKLIF